MPGFGRGELFGDHLLGGELEVAKLGGGGVALVIGAGLFALLAAAGVGLMLGSALQPGGFPWVASSSISSTSSGVIW